MRSNAYCTYFDSCYLARGIVMLRSLLRHDPGAEIHVLALDDLCERVIGDVFSSAIQVIGIDTLHAGNPSLRECHEQRSRWGFYATHKPELAQFVLRSAPASVTFIDSDTWFFADPAPMFVEIGEASIGLSPHRLHAATRHIAMYGTYNAGCIYWRADETGARCVADWRNDCIEWCDDQVQQDGRFMNQGYLNDWPKRYSSVHIIRHPGVNLAPWNVDGHHLARVGDRIAVDAQPLIFYHFSGLMRDREGRWFSPYSHLNRQRDLAYEAIYRPYLEAVETERRSLKQAYDVEGTGTVRSITFGPDAMRLW